jgi:hypothetical protein
MGQDGQDPTAEAQGTATEAKGATTGAQGTATGAGRPSAEPPRTPARPAPAAAREAAGHSRVPVPGLTLTVIGNGRYPSQASMCVGMPALPAYGQLSGG